MSAEDCRLHEVAEVLLRNSLRAHPDREGRLQVAAGVLLQMGGVPALRAELEHERAREHPDWAAALRAQIEQWTGGPAPAADVEDPADRVCWCGCGDYD